MNDTEFNTIEDFEEHSSSDSSLGYRPILMLYRKSPKIILWKFYISPTGQIYQLYKSDKTYSINWKPLSFDDMNTRYKNVSSNYVWEWLV